jgi:hypothetical protein
MRKSFNHNLIEEFQYSKKGEFEKASFITVTAPKSSDFYEGLQFLDSLYTRAEFKTLKNIAGILKELTNLTAEQETQAKASDEMLDDEDSAINAYNQLISGLEQDEIAKLNICICELLKKSATVNGEDKFEASFFDEMAIEDRRIITGKYLINFTSTVQRNSKKG